MLRIGMIGLGSIGCRHLKNLIFVMTNRNITYSIDALRSSKRELPHDIACLLDRQYYSMDEMPSDYDIIFISNPTFMHYNTLKAAVNKSKHIFLEKPVFESLDYSMSEFKDLDSVMYVACPLRYHPTIQAIQKRMKQGERYISVRATSSSYLPEWRKNVDYRNIYSAHREQGGGVVLDLIHEWDYLTYLFGMPEKVFTFSGKYSNLEINSEDLATYIASYPDKLIELHLDYFGRETTRCLELYTNTSKISADIIHNKLIINSQQGKEILDLEQKDMYIEEMEYFFDCIEGKKKNDNSVQHAYDVLKIAMNDWGKQ